MRKTFIALLASGLLLAAVICTAGCIASGPDPILGTWYHEDGNTVDCLIFDEDGVGNYAYLADEEDPSDESYAIPITWTRGDNNTYSVQLAEGGDTISFTLNQTSWTFTTTEGDVYTKIANVVSIFDSIFG